MFGIGLTYATPSAYESQKARGLLGISADAQRPVRFVGKVKPPSIFLLRTVLRAFGELIWSSEVWSRADFGQQLDPVVTVHPDGLFLEAFSRDHSVYGLVHLSNDLFDLDIEPLYGTSHINFTAWLWAALAEMRSSRSTWLHLDSAGLELATVGAGGRFEKTVQVEDTWLRGFLQLQQAMTMPGTHLQARPVDLLGAVRFLRYSKARTAPRALRYEFIPGQDARIVLEPWEKVFALRGAAHQASQPRSVRTWGRQRLRLLEPVLPFAQSVDIWLKGRNMPSFYQTHLPGMSLLLGLSGGGSQKWSEDGDLGYDLLQSELPVDEAKKNAALELLTQQGQLSYAQLGQALGLERAPAQALLSALCREGQALYRLDTRCYLYRPLFGDKPLTTVFPAHPRFCKARDLQHKGLVTVASCLPRETRKVQRLAGSDGLREVILRDWCLEGSVDDQEAVEVVLNDTDRIIFGRCGCSFFQTHLLASGPCEHLLALRLAVLEGRPDLPTSVDAEEAQEG